MKSQLEYNQNAYKPFLFSHLPETTLIRNFLKKFHQNGKKIDQEPAGSLPVDVSDPTKCWKMPLRIFLLFE